jgi:hypothetical protein
VHEASAVGADPAQVAGRIRQPDELRHIACRPSRRPAFDAIALIGLALHPRPFACGEEVKHIFPQDQHWLLVSQSGQPALDPAPHRSLRGADDASQLVDRVATMDLDPACDASRPRFNVRTVAGFS